MQLESIHLYPVKGCYRVDLATARVEPWGLAGDRRWLITDPDGAQITQRDTAALTHLRAVPLAGGLTLRYPGQDELALRSPDPDPVASSSIWGTRLPATPAGQGADEWLSRALGREVRLVWMDDPTRRAADPEYAQPGDTVSYADGYPLLLTTPASLDRLNDWIAEGGSLEGPLPMTRFRPNVVVSGTKPFEEDEWLGLRIAVGAVTLRVVKPCSRCVVTTTDQETGERGREPLRTLARYRNVDQKLMFGMNLIPDGPGVIRIGDEVTVL